MLVTVERLLIKLRQPASRARELITLRRRLRAERATAPAEDEQALAQAVHARKLALAAAVGDVTSCGSCARGQPLPTGHFAGGACCAGVTNELFDDAELAALARAGTRPRDLVAPTTDHAGCAFRSATSCTLALVHRPARCVHYLCDSLKRELHTHARLDAVEAAQGALNTAMQQFRTAREARLDRELLAPLVAAVEATRR